MSAIPETNRNEEGRERNSDFPVEPSPFLSLPEVLRGAAYISSGGRIYRLFPEGEETTILHASLETPLCLESTEFIPDSAEDTQKPLAPQVSAPHPIRQASEPIAELSLAAIESMEEELERMTRRSGSSETTMEAVRSVAMGQTIVSDSSVEQTLRRQRAVEGVLGSQKNVLKLRITKERPAMIPPKAAKVPLRPTNVDRPLLKLFDAFSEPPTTIVETPEIPEPENVVVAQRTRNRIDEIIVPSKIASPKNDKVSAEARTDIAPQLLDLPPSVISESHRLRKEKRTVHSCSEAVKTVENRSVSEAVDETIAGETAVVESAPAHAASPAENSTKGTTLNLIRLEIRYPQRRKPPFSPRTIERKTRQIEEKSKVIDNTVVESFSPVMENEMFVSSSILEENVLSETVLTVYEEISESLASEGAEEVDGIRETVVETVETTDTEIADRDNCQGEETPISGRVENRSDCDGDEDAVETVDKTKSGEVDVTKTSCRIDQRIVFTSIDLNVSESTDEPAASIPFPEGSSETVTKDEVCSGEDGDCIWRLHWQPTWPRHLASLEQRAPRQIRYLADHLEIQFTQGRRVVSFNGYRPEDGCTTLSLCAARELAERGYRLLLADAHRQHPELARLLELDIDPHHYEIMTLIPDKLELLPWSESPIEIDLQGESHRQSFAEIVASLRTEYDGIILDGGSLIESPLADRIAQWRQMRSDGVLLVVDTKNPEPINIKAVAHRLQQFNVELLGVAENYV